MQKISNQKSKIKKVILISKLNRNKKFFFGSIKSLFTSKPGNFNYNEIDKNNREYRKQYSEISTKIHKKKENNLSCFVELFRILK